jgi:anhydro-N-acetylmuramic acid kinase
VTRVVGLMSGTSVDAVDVAAAELVLDGGTLRMRRLGEREVPLPSELRSRVLDALSPAVTTAQELCRLDAELGRTFAEAAMEGIERLADGHVDLVVSHGQTLHHEVVDGRVHGTLQVGQAAYVAERTGVAVVSDLRPRDVAAGGQGAPLVPVLDELLLAAHDDVAACGNLGGIANLSVVTPGRKTLAFDVGPANALLDLAVRRATADAVTHDEGGERARRGQVHEGLLEVLLDDPYLRRPPPKTTGKERYHARYLDEALARRPVASPEDLLATLAAAVADAIVADAARVGVRDLYVSGGGVHNAAVMARLRAGLGAHGIRLERTEALGMPSDAKEAYAMALLGWLTWHGLPGNVPSATGAQGPRVLGTVTPGEGPWPGPRLSGRPERMIVEEPTKASSPTSAAGAKGHG